MGDFVLDSYVYGDCDQVSDEAPVPVLRVVRRESHLGGAAAVAANVTALGAEVCCLGVVGQDAPGEQIVAQLLSVRAEVSSLMKLRSRPTTTKQRLIGLAQKRHQQRILRVDEEDDAELPEEVLSSLRGAVRSQLRNCRVLAIEDYGKGVVGEQATPAIIADAAAAKLPVVVDAAALDDYSRYRGATLLICNRRQAERVGRMAIINDESLERIAERIVREAGCGGIVITLARDGSYLKQAGRPGERFATRERPVYDVTGAGDMVLSMLAVALAGGAEPDAAVSLANVAAGLEVERYGNVPVRRDELVAELDRMKRQRHGKVVGLDELLAEVVRLHQAGKAVVWTNGCFDILHAGHVGQPEFRPPPGRRADRGDQLRRLRPAEQGPRPADRQPGGPRRGAGGAGVRRLRHHL